MSGERSYDFIWFMIGALLTIYGVMIVGTGVYHLFWPVGRVVVLDRLRPDIWWGAVVLAIGLIYTLRFFPGRHRD